jgi:hypothetical protein
VQLPHGQREPYGPFLRHLRDTGRLVSALRPGPWGNPFLPAPADRPEFRAVTVDRYRAWLAGTGADVIHTGRRRGGYDRGWQLDHLGGLAGRALGCRCPTGEPCHASVLAELANETRRPKIERPAHTRKA